jgi:hypothetical protein
MHVYIMTEWHFLLSKLKQRIEIQFMDSDYPFGIL